MAQLPAITFKKTAPQKSGTVIVQAVDDKTLAEAGLALDEASDGQLTRAMKAAGFKAKSGAAIEVLAPQGTGLDRVIVAAVGDDGDLAAWLALGGKLAARIKHGQMVAIFPEVAPGGGSPDASSLAALAEGLLLRAYAFDKYKTRVDDDDTGRKKAARIAIMADNPAAARRAFSARRPVVDGTILARNLVNEPANTLGPEEFAAEAKALTALGAKVTVLTERQMAAKKMDALLAVGRGSERESRLAVIEWAGGKKKEPPVCFVGKGVVFDTGGVSLKPPAGMEDMKGDMGGAAAVIGLMHALAGRKAKVNAVGILGLVENMPDGRAQRPGDIVTSMSGQTIEVINTDAEGRLVLCDALWYAQKTFRPKCVIDLATLTGAIMVALGSENAGLFSNDDELAAQLLAASEATGEGVWRMPLGKAYDKMIDSKFADMKNTGGRWGGAVTAAQFLQRFIEDGVPWAHLDIAGTAMGSPKTAISQGWASGFGVRLLDRLVADNYEG